MAHTVAILPSWDVGAHLSGSLAGYYVVEAQTVAYTQLPLLPLSCSPQVLGVGKATADMGTVVPNELCSSSTVKACRCEEPVMSLSAQSLMTVVLASRTPQHTTRRRSIQHNAIDILSLRIYVSPSYSG